MVLEGSSWTGSNGHVLWSSSISWVGYKSDRPYKDRTKIEDCNACNCLHSERHWHYNMCASQATLLKAEQRCRETIMTLKYVHHWLLYHKQINQFHVPLPTIRIFSNKSSVWYEPLLKLRSLSAWKYISPTVLFLSETSTNTSEANRSFDR